MKRSEFEDKTYIAKMFSSTHENGIWATSYLKKHLTIVIGPCEMVNMPKFNSILVKQLKQEDLLQLEAMEYMLLEEMRKELKTETPLTKKERDESFLVKLHGCFSLFDEDGKLKSADDLPDEMEGKMLLEISGLVGNNDDVTYHALLRVKQIKLISNTKGCMID